MRYWAAFVVSILFSGSAFYLAADSVPKPERRRFSVPHAAVAGSWTSGYFKGRRQVLENRIARPILRFSNPGADAYWVRIFYLLDSEKPALAELDGKAVARLKGGGKWRRADFPAPYASKGAARNISFRLPEGGRLYVRRVDFRNYLIRLGEFFSLKPAGGARASASVQAIALWWLLFGALFFAAGAIFRRGESPMSARLAKIFLPAGALGLIVVIVHLASGYAVHAHPVFVIAVFVGTLALAASKTPLRLAAGRLVGATLATLLALVLAEAVLLVWDPPMSRPRVKSYAMYSPELGWMNRPGAEGWHVDIGYHIRINSHGLRGPEISLDKPKGVFRILGLGDSFSFGWGVEEEETYLRVLEAKLRAAGYRVEVLNAGVPAWHSVQSLGYLMKRGLRFGPDLILAEFFVDDVYKSSLGKLVKSDKAVKLREEEADVKQKKALSSWSPRLYHLWFNYQKNRRAERDYKRRNPYPNFESEQKILPRDFDKKAGRVADLKAIVSEWKKTREKIKLPIVIYYMPAGGALNSPPHQGEYRALRQLSLEAGFPFYDVVNLYESDPAPRKLYLHPKDGHLGAKGHAVLADALAKMIIERGYLKKP